MGRAGSEREIKKTFDSVDIDRSGFIDRTEFAFSLMGEKAMDYGTAADLEILSNLLSDTANLLSNLKNGLSLNSESNESRAARNDELRARMQEMKKNLDGNMGAVIGKMMGLMGQDPMDLLTDDEVNKLLFETFKKFDKDGSGALEKAEFMKAWTFLGLEGTPEEMERAFAGVDNDGSGFIDKFEFT